MLLVKTKLNLSPKHGIGLFAAEFIPKGHVTWKYHPEFDSAFTIDQVNSMCNVAKERFFVYAYFDKELDRFILAQF